MSAPAAESTGARWRRYWTAFNTIATRETRRYLRIWLQTLVPPAITMTLYFVIFGSLIGERIGPVAGFDYMAYIVPGLIMMSVITNAYTNVVSSFFGAKFQRFVEELLVAPVPGWIILAGFVAGGVGRALLVGLLVTGVSLFFWDVSIAHPWIVASVVLLTAILFSLGGFLNAIFARKFDDISIVPTFVLTPLTYLGGVFYSIDMLPTFWQQVSLANPVLYMVNAFRYGFLGTADIPIAIAYGIIGLVIVLLTGIALVLLERGTGIRT